MEGRQMVMVLSPRKKEIKVAKPKETKPKAVTETDGATPAIDSDPVSP
jgi:translation initiation factor IF-3